MNIGHAVRAIVQDRTAGTKRNGRPVAPVKLFAGMVLVLPMPGGPVRWLIQETYMGSDKKIILRSETGQEHEAVKDVIIGQILAGKLWLEDFRNNTAMQWGPSK